MTVIKSTANCLISESEPFICVQCGRRYRGPNTIANCIWGSIAGQTIKAGILGLPKPKQRERTAEEIELVILTCAVCPHRTDEGVCGLLKRAGCGSCKSASDFAAKIRRGIGCPDSPPRFGATPEQQSNEQELFGKDILDAPR